MSSSIQSGKQKVLPRKRRLRGLGFNDSILSGLTVYLNPCTEIRSHLTVEEAAAFAAVTRYFREKNS